MTVRLLEIRSRIAVAALLVATSASAQAQGPARERPLAQSLQGPAKDAYMAGNLLMKHGDFAGAELKYAQAYDYSKDPRLLFNEAVAEKEMHHYARMQAFLLRYERETGSSIAPDDRAGVDVALAAIKNLVGYVTVTSNVDGAELAVDDQTAGMTPQAEPLTLDLGKHKLVVRKAGFDPVERTIEVPGGGSLMESITLVPHVRTAQLIVVAEPGATVIVDGSTVARGRFDGAVSAGTHGVRVMAPGKVTYQSEVDLREGQTRTLEVTLVGRPTVWPWVVGGAVAAVGVSVGAYFLLRPQGETRPAPTGAFGGGTLSSFAGRW